jgi:POT family proton-dependent oligopeptide transporter
MTDPTPPKRSFRIVEYFRGHPTGFWFFFWGELAERCSFYGMQAILLLYMVETLGIAKPNASSYVSFFTAFCFLTPLLGGFIADRFLGRYWTIVGFSVPFIIGNALMMVTGSIPLMTGLMFVSLAVIALGSGVIKPNISTLMGMTYDQQRPGQDQLRSDAFTMFYWAINIGSLISQSLMPELRNRYGANFAFVLPTVLMIVAMIIFALGKKHYAIETVKQDNTLTPEQSRDRWVVLGRLLGVFILCAVFWSIFKHYSTVWVLYIGERVNLNVWGEKVLKADQFSPLNAVFILTLLPLASFLYKWLARSGINLRPTDKMQIGFVFVLLTPLLFVLSEFVFESGKGQVPAYWIVLIFFCITAAEVLISPVGLELAFVAAPKSMKGLITACFLLTNFFGNTLNGFVTPFYSKVNEVGDRIMTPTQYFGLQAIVALATVVAFSFVAKPFNRRLAQPNLAPDAPR